MCARRPFLFLIGTALGGWCLEHRENRILTASLPGALTWPGRQPDAKNKTPLPAATHHPGSLCRPFPRKCQITIDDPSSISTPHRMVCPATAAPISTASPAEKGLIRSEGKEYVVKDGDIILFRFNV